ncbi:MAG: hypothetical protein LC122_12280 [Chitinophagales bacterium]|nr:hypothetical protein [Chitinophagales bacterium]
MNSFHIDKVKFLRFKKDSELTWFYPVKGTLFILYKNSIYRIVSFRYYNFYNKFSVKLEPEKGMPMFGQEIPVSDIEMYSSNYDLLKSKTAKIKDIG